EAAMKKLEPFFSAMGKPWTDSHAFPGGNFGCSREQLVRSLTEQYPWLSDKLAMRYVRQFCTYTHKLLSNIGSEEEMGQQFADGVYQC
ncbi:hypothetical protein AKJ18_37810, partial [Vibrio xuii]